MKKIKSNEKTLKQPPGSLSAKKRHFQLLELMIAAFILLVCIAPTMSIFTKMYVSQHEMMRENQRDHVAHLVHAHLVEQLYKGNIILSEGMDAPIQLDSKELTELLHKHAYGLQGTMQIVDREPKIKDPAKEYLVEIRFELKDASRKKTKGDPETAIVFDYLVYIDSDPSEKKKDKGIAPKKDKNEEKEGEKNGAGENQMNTPAQLPKPPQMAPPTRRGTENGNE